MFISADVHHIITGSFNSQTEGLGTAFTLLIQIHLQSVKQCGAIIRHDNFSIWRRSRCRSVTRGRGLKQRQANNIRLSETHLTPMGIKLNRFDIGFKPSRLQKRLPQPLNDTKVIIMALQISGNTSRKIVIAAPNKGVRDTFGQ